MVTRVCPSSSLHRVGAPLASCSSCVRPWLRPRQVRAGAIAQPRAPSPLVASGRNLGRPTRARPRLAASCFAEHHVFCHRCPSVAAVCCPTRVAATMELLLPTIPVRARPPCPCPAARGRAPVPAAGCRAALGSSCRCSCSMRLLVAALLCCCLLYLKSLLLALPDASLLLQTLSKRPALSRLVSTN